MLYLCNLFVQFIALFFIYHWCLRQLIVIFDQDLWNYNGSSYGRIIKLMMVSC
jgi:hypothetical protein